MWLVFNNCPTRTSEWYCGLLVMSQLIQGVEPIKKRLKILLPDVCDVFVSSGSLGSMITLTQSERSTFVQTKLFVESVGTVTAVMQNMFAYVLYGRGLTCPVAAEFCFE